VIKLFEIKFLYLISIELTVMIYWRVLYWYDVDSYGMW